MSLGPDVKEIYQELGRRYEVLREGVAVAEESLLHKANTQATKPFVLLAHLKVRFPFDTIVKGGDVIRFKDDGSHYTATMMQPDVFENEIVYFFSVVYRCNCRVELEHWNALGRDANERRTGAWDPLPLGTGLFGCIADPYQGEEIESERESGESYGKEIYDLYIPNRIGITTGVSCRVTPFGMAEARYKATRIKRFIFDGVAELRVETDGR